MGLVGQGIILLRRADGEKDPKRPRARKKAKTGSRGEGRRQDLLEAQIGAATADSPRA
jgi:hypothetical protein